MDNPEQSVELIGSLLLDNVGCSGKHIVAGDRVFTQVTDRSLSKLPPEQYMLPDQPDSITSVHDLKWIHPSTPFMLLIPKYHPFRGSILERLDYLDGRFPVKRHAHNASWSLDPRISEEWSLLEHIMRSLTIVMLELASPPLPISFRLWAWPSQYRYRCSHPSRSVAQSAAKASRDAFLPLMGAMTFAIMCMHEKMSRLGDQPYLWREKVLERTGIHPSWLSALEASSIADRSLPRVGGIVNVAQWRSLDLLLYLRRANMPFYIYWGRIDTLEVPIIPALSAKGCIPTNGDIRTLKQQSLVTLKSTNRPSPNPPSSSSNLHAPLSSSLSPPNLPSGDPGIPRLNRDTGQYEGETWQEFFARRETRNRLKESGESPNAKQSRMMRERNAEKMVCPGRHGATVWIWDSVGDTRIRRMAGRRHYMDIWERYGGGQKRYDSFSNCWDICSEFDPDATLSDVEDDYDQHGLEEGDGQDNELRSALAQVNSSSLLPEEPCSLQLDLTSVTDLQQLHPKEDRVFHMTFTDTMEQVAYERFGFVVGHGDGTGLGMEKWELVRKFLGNGCWLDDGIFSEPDPSPSVKASLQVFFKTLSTPENISTLSLPSYDILDPSADLRVETTLRFRLRLVSFPDRPIYLLSPSSGDTSRSHSSWELGLSNPCTVLQLMRCQWGPHLEDAARELITRGIAFHTLIRGPPPSSGYKLVPHSNSVGLGFRSVNYTPDVLDFQSYQNLRESFLRGPRGRAAVLAGGILARLARDVVRPEDVIYGPSDDVVLHGYCLEDQSSDVSYWDDRLTESEINLICGVYRVDTGQSHKDDGHQTADMSWWPKPIMFGHAGLGVGYWSKDCERWFLRRLNECKEGRAKLRSSSGWKDILKLTRAVPKIVKKAEMHSKDFLKEYILSSQ